MIWQKRVKVKDPPWRPPLIMNSALRGSGSVAFMTLQRGVAWGLPVFKTVISCPLFHPLVLIPPGSYTDVF